MFYFFFLAFFLAALRAVVFFVLAFFLAALAVFFLAAFLAAFFFVVLAVLAPFAAVVFFLLALPEVRLAEEEPWPKIRSQPAEYSGVAPIRTMGPLIVASSCVSKTPGNSVWKSA